MKDEPEKMLAELPEEFYEAYGKVRGITIARNGDRIEAVATRDKIPVWPPRQEDLWKMVGGTVSVSRSPEGLWWGSMYWGGVDAGIAAVGGPEDIVSLDEVLLQAWGLQHGYRWDSATGKWVRA